MNDLGSPEPPAPSRPPALFEYALTYTLANEGTVITNDPRDTGGLTHYGITQRIYSKYLGRAATAADMAAINRETAAEFYRKVFWEPLCQRLPNAHDEVLVALFDMSVHCGAPAAVGMAQQAVGVRVDGKLGPKTQAAIEALTPEQFLRAYVPKVTERYCRIVSRNPVQLVFLNGWVHRANRLFSLADARLAVA